MDIDMVQDSLYPTQDYPQPPFCFKSLPAELRAAVVESVSSNPPGSIAELPEEDRLALQALSMTDRELSRLATAILWRHVIFHHHSTDSLAFFIQHILPHRGVLIRSADFGGPYTRAPSTEAGMQAVRERWAMWMAIAEGLTGVRSLDIKALPFTSPLLLVTSPSLWSSPAPNASAASLLAPTNTATGALTSLTISGYPQPLLDGDALAVVLDRFPLLAKLSLTLIDGCHNGGFAPALKRLRKLQRLELRNVECADGRLLEGSWQSEIRDLVVSDCSSLSLENTVELVRQLSSSLETVDLLLEHAEIPPSLNSDDSLTDTPPFTMAPIILPRVTTMSLELTPSKPTTYAFLAALQAPALIRLNLLHTSHYKPDLAVVMDLVDRCKDFKWLGMNLPMETAQGWQEFEEDDPIGSARRLELACEKRNIHVEWELLAGA